MGGETVAPAGAGARVGGGQGGSAGLAALLVSRARRMLAALVKWPTQGRPWTETSFRRRRRRWRQVRTRWRLRQLREQARADRLERFIARMSGQMREEQAQLAALEEALDKATERG